MPNSRRAVAAWCVLLPSSSSPIAFRALSPPSVQRLETETQTSSREKPRPTRADVSFPVVSRPSSTTAVPGRRSRTPFPNASRPPRSRTPQLKALCCVGTTRGEQSHLDHVEIDDHDSPLVTRAGSGSSSGNQFGASSASRRLRASTPPPFETASRSRRNARARARNDDDGSGSGSGPSSRDSGFASECSLSTSDGEDALWREKRRLLRGNDNGNDATATATARAVSASDSSGAHLGILETPAPRRRRSFEVSARAPWRAETGPEKTKPGGASRHHRTESEPAGSSVSSVCVPPDFARGVANDANDANDARDARGSPSRASDEPFEKDGDAAAGSLGTEKTALSNDCVDRLRKASDGRSTCGRSASGVSLASASCDEDSCPTCFEAYDSENPKMLLACGHHFHLGCIYEWYERSDKCPVCEVKMAFDPSTGWSLEG